MRTEEGHQSPLLLAKSDMIYRAGSSKTDFLLNSIIDFGIDVNILTWPVHGLPRNPAYE